MGQGANYAEEKLRGVPVNRKLRCNDERHFEPRLRVYHEFCYSQKHVVSERFK